MASWSFWIDRGGTFTDTVALSPSGQLLSSKFLSVNPQKYDDAAVHSIRNFLSISDHLQIPVSQIDAIKIGTTVATNALLERKGARTVLVITRGFEDQLQLEDGNIITLGKTEFKSWFELDIHTLFTNLNSDKT